MSEPVSVEGSAPAGPVRFPPGESRFADRPFHRGLFAEVDALIGRGACPDGRFEVTAGDLRLTALIHDSSPWLAGYLDGKRYGRMSLYDFVIEAGRLEGAVATLTRTDRPLMMMAAVHFCQRPHLEGSTRLVDPLHLLQALAEDRRDAALAFEWAGSRTLVFILNGRPARLYFGDPAADSGTIALEDQTLRFAFSPSAPPTKLEVFKLERIQADRDAGTPFDALARTARAVPPTLVTLGLPGGRVLSQRFFTPSEMVVGRERSCELRVDNPAVSRRHCRIYWGRGRFFVEDLGSANGTYVNGEQVNRREIEPGDDIRVGKFLVRLSDGSDGQAELETMLVGTRSAGAPALLKSGDLAVRLERDVIVGRGAGVDAPARGLFVRAVHARISPKGIGIYRLTCFGRARVKLNGKRIRTSRIEIGDVIEVGATTFKVTAEGREEVSG